MTLYKPKSFRASSTLPFLIALLISIYLLLPNPSALSPAAQLAISLSHRFPSTPISEHDAQINWHSPTHHDLLATLFLNSADFSHSLPPSVGSPQWAASYPPPNKVGPAPKRQWIRRLQWVRKQLAPQNALLAAALAVPPARLESDGYVVYPPGTQIGSGLGACNWERGGCLRQAKHGYRDELDIVDADNRTWVVNFDDGPLPPSRSLYQLLDKYNAKATHFWIGGNVLKHWDLALLANARGDHLAVHTWSHAHLTSLTDSEVLGELGWTMQVIKDLTGKVPRYFRPPYGNIDNRVRAIAKHVFGLETVIWNHDSVDWGLNQTYATGDQVDAPDPNSAPNLESVIGTIEALARDGVAGRPTAGALLLEHELSEESVSAFGRSWEAVTRAGWKTGTLPECISDGKAEWYQ